MVHSVSDTTQTADRIARIDRMLPTPVTDLDDDALLAAYDPGSGDWLRMNFISSLDGAATRDGRSGGLGDAADRRVFALLRRPADVVLVGAGTARVEEYGALRLGEADVRWRTGRGLPEHPVLAIISGSLDLDPEAGMFTDAPTRPLIYTLASASADRRAALQSVADVVDAGETELDPAVVRADLRARGLGRVHAEGGPHVLGAFLAADAVDELCLTLAPSVEAGDAGRIARSDAATPREMRLVSMLRAGDELLLRYRVSR